MANLTFVEPGTPEWEQAWYGLGLHTGGDLREQCKCCGESWQYMGTVDGKVHQFRHRHWPKSKARKYLNIGV